MFQVLSREGWYGAICMAQAWHKKREQLETAWGVEAKLWRASEYKVDEVANAAVIKAAPNASWKRFMPFDSYKPTSKAREVKAGPHLHFLRLKGLWEADSDLFYTALKVFAGQYGLLGALEEDYDLQRPVFPWEKMLVAPEAGIDGQGRLSLFDPNTEGKSLLRTILAQRGWGRLPNDPEIVFNWMALPSEIKFNAKRPDLNSEWWPIEPRQLVPWEVLQNDFGAIMVLDPQAFKGVSVLCTKEPVRRWALSLHFFPSGDTPMQELVSVVPNSFNAYLQEVSPRIVVGKDGSLEQGWNCSTLMQAMRLMLHMDLTGGHTIKECQSRDCSNHFRLGPQAKSIYCSQRCANRASTRMRRGQEP